MVYILGDVRNRNYSMILSERFNLRLCGMTKKDIILFYAPSTLVSEEGFIEWLNERPYTSIILDGDEKLMDVIKDQPVSKRFGSRAFQPADSVYCIADSGMYTVEHQKLLICCLDWADRKCRDKYNEWSLVHMRRFAAAYKRHGCKADFIITRIPPHLIARKYDKHRAFDYNALYFDRYVREDNFFRWIFNDYKKDISIEEKYYCVFRHLLVLDKDDFRRIL